MENKPKKRLLIYQASAGAGKTYLLSRRYVNLLKGVANSLKGLSNREKGEKLAVCGKNSDRNCRERMDFLNLDSLIAITFTNKAAAEMKERVLRFLKEIAAGFSPGEGFEIEREDALALLVFIIENFSDFQITTIDSFMNNIFKAFAVDLKVYPDYEITFDEEEIFDMAFGKLLSDSANRQALLDFLKALLKVETKGFDGERIVKKALKSFKESGFFEKNVSFSEDGFISGVRESESFSYLWNTLVSEFEAKFGSFYGDKNAVSSFEEALDFIVDEMQKRYEKVREKVSLNQSLFNKTKIKWLNKESVRDSFNASFWQNMLKGGEPALLILNNKGEETIGIELRNELNGYLKSMHFLFKAFYLFKIVLNSHSGIKVYRGLSLKEGEIRRNLNIVEGGRITERVKSVLNDFSVPYAFCRLGERISHYLIDEFQDTSDIQLDAMFPLVHNALSEGGSLFVVGDKKQAIYGWRGGDYRVFDRIDGDYSPSPEYTPLRAVVNDDEFLKESPDKNYRSAEIVVRFNNLLLDRIFSPNFKEGVVGKFFKSKEEKDSALKKIEEVFRQSRQIADKKGKPGLVRVDIFPCIKGEEYESCREEGYRESFFKVLDSVLPRFSFKDIMILARRKKDLEKAADFIFEYNVSRNTDIPIITEDSLKLLANGDVLNILALALFFVNPADLSLFKALGENGFFPVSKRDFFNALKDERDFSFSKAKTVLNSLLPEAIKEDFLKSFEECYLSLSSLTPYEFFVKVGALFDSSLFDDNGGFNLSSNASYFDRFFEVVLNLTEKGYSVSEIADYFYKNRDITLSMPENIDAVKLLTIHKAKGLEAEVVIIPFYDWEMVDSKDTEFVEVDLSEWFEGTKGKTIVAKADGDLRKVSNTANEFYFQSKVKKFIESLNLMYVANTRPKTELYINAGLKVNEKGEFNGKINSCYVLWKLLSDENSLKNGFLFEKGDKVIRKPGRKQIERKPEKLNFSPSIREYFISLKKEDVYFDYAGEKFGNFFHLAMSFVKGIKSREEIEPVVENAFEKAKNLSGGVEVEGVRDLILKAVNLLSDYFVNVDGEWNEKEIVSKKGYIFRLDRLVLKNGEFTVIDYKTGAKKIEEHKTQVLNYVNVLKGQGARVRGIIYYAEDGEIVNV